MPAQFSAHEVASLLEKLEQLSVIELRDTIAALNATITPTRNQIFVRRIAKILVARCAPSRPLYTVGDRVTFNGPISDDEVGIVAVRHADRTYDIYWPSIARVVTGYPERQMRHADAVGACR